MGEPVVHLRHRLCGAPGGGGGGETGGSLEARTSDIVCIKREFLRNPRFNPPLTVAPDASMP